MSHRRMHSRRVQDSESVKAMNNVFFEVEWGIIKHLVTIRVTVEITR